MESTLDNLKAAAQRAVKRETVAWWRLQADRAQCTGDQHQAIVDEWFKAREGLREAGLQLVAGSLARSLATLRDSASLLRRRGAPPATGQCYRARDGAIWDVIQVTYDVLEPALYLAVLQRREPTRAEEIYCLDWDLFCVFHGLQAPE